MKKGGSYWSKFGQWFQAMVVFWVPLLEPLLGLNGYGLTTLLALCGYLCLQLAFGWFWGRVGCFTAHDHIGHLSNSVLAVDFGNSKYESYYGGACHDLGLYEAIFVFFIAVIFYSVRKKEIYHSSFAILFVCSMPCSLWS